MHCCNRIYAPSSSSVGASPDDAACRQGAVKGPVDDVSQSVPPGGGSGGSNPGYRTSSGVGLTT